jgi:CheY-like chemotaxis protein
MKKEVRILILEDVPANAELMEHKLQKIGIEFSAKCVETFEEPSYKSPPPLIEAMVVGLLDVGAVCNLGFTSAAVGDVVLDKGGYEP